MIEKHRIKDDYGRLDKQLWLNLRKPDVTASVIGALDRLHPYMTPRKLYMIHSGVEFPEKEDTSAMRRGRILEPSVKTAVLEERPHLIIDENRFYWRETDLRLGATPDFFIHGDPRGLGVLQAKTAKPDVYERDWDNGRVLPLWIKRQCLVECMLTDAAFGIVAVISVSAYDLPCAIFEVRRDPALESAILTGVRLFWDDVANGREPEADYLLDADILAIIAPRAIPDKTIDLSGDNELPTLLAQREEMKDRIKTWDQKCDEIENKIRFKMLDSEQVVGIDGWKISWKNQHTPEYTVPARDNRVLRIFDKRGAA